MKNRNISKPRTGGKSKGGQLSRVAKPANQKGKTSQGNIEKK